MKNTLIIYPHDATTSFLIEPFQFLQKRIKSVTFYEVHPNDESHKECNSLISKFDVIIFMGHGSFKKLSGAKSENYSNEYLISEKEIKLLSAKKWILFSCNSNDLLQNCSMSINSGLGFGDLPTDFNDIIGIREFNNQAYLNINEDVINGFKVSINWIIIESIVELIERNLSIKDLYYFNRTLITKRMLDILTDSNDVTQKEHAKLLFAMKNEMLFIDNNI